MRAVTRRPWWTCWPPGPWTSRRSPRARSPSTTPPRRSWRATRSWCSRAPERRCAASSNDRAPAVRGRCWSTGSVMNALVRVLDVDPHLGPGLDPRNFAVAERELVTDTLSVPRGRWDAEAAWAAVPAELGMLIIQGVMVRDVRLGKRATLEVLGP